jgi:ABC-type glycerol-3-phosphate transport system substrate-binding protein
MKKLGSLVAAIALTFGLAACSDNKSAEPVTTVTVTASPTPSQSVTSGVSDADFANLIRENTNAFDGATDSQIVDAGKSVCGLWAAGGDINDVIQAVMESGVDPGDGGYLAGAGTRAYCPEYVDQIPSNIT